jgi:ankyrin repeat protein
LIQVKDKDYMVSKLRVSVVLFVISYFACGQLGSDAIFNAARTGDLAKIKKYFIRHNTFDMQDKNGASLLIIAARHGKTDVVKYLLEIGANVNLINKDGASALWFAVASDKFNDTIVNILINNNADVNVVDSIYMNTPLMLASAKGRIDAVDLLLDHGAEANKKDKSFASALYYATRFNHTDIALKLLQKGATFLVSDNQGRTPLFLAIINGNVKIVNGLYENGASLAQKDINEATPIIYAAAEGHLDLVKYLINKKVDLNAKTTEGKTALMMASREGKFEIVKELLKNGADTQIKDSKGRSALDIAIQEGHKDIAKLLEKK